MILKLKGHSLNGSNSVKWLPSFKENMIRHSELNEKALCHLQWEVQAVQWEVQADLWEAEEVLWEAEEVLWEEAQAVLMEDQVVVGSLIHLVQWEMVQAVREVQWEVQWEVLVEEEWISHL
jgi:hypothetical protein